MSKRDDFINKLDLRTDIETKGWCEAKNILCISFNLFQLVVQWTLVTAVRRQMDALREGFNSVLPLSNLTSFSYTEVILIYLY